MNLQKMQRWQNLLLSEKIQCLVTYAAIFNDVVSIKDIQDKLRVDDELLHVEITHLVQKKSIVVKDGFIAVPGLVEKIAQKENDYRICNELITRKYKLLRFIGKMPFIKFIGISGSVTVNNPSTKGITDLDVFVITSPHSIWFVGIMLAIYQKLIKKKPGYLCFNNIWDESDLMVYNPNFYIANEIYNMIPVSGHTAYYHFLNENRWIHHYFPDFIIPQVKQSRKLQFTYFNKFFYLVFSVFRCIKKRSITPLHHFFSKEDPYQSISRVRRAAENGGYQQLIQSRFSRLLLQYFPELDIDLIDHILFPDALSQRIRSNPDYDFGYQFNHTDRELWAANYLKYL